jgi:glycosyltransferase involved in cell wall biosynthesis
VASARKVMPSRPMVALVCGNVYPHFDLSVPAVGGGMETRAAIFGRGLAAGGRWQVSFMVSDFGQPFVTRHEDIDFHIYQTTYRSAGRNVFPRLRERRWLPALNWDRRDLGLFWQIPLIATYLTFPAFCFPRFWRNLNPQVVCCFGNNERSAEVIADCHRLGIRTILCIASDKDISSDYQPGNYALNHYGMPKWKGHYALTTADCIVVQTEAQKEALRQQFGLPAVLIRNPVQVSPEDAQRWLPRDQREFVLWIGRTDNFNKRPMLFLELAKSCPDLRFLMIISRTEEAVFLALQAACPDNLRIIEHVPPTEIWGYLSRARVFVNTSRFEGFPNTFLQCAVMGVPIVSLEVDPDGILTHHGCGILAGDDPDTLRLATRRLWDDNAQAEALVTAYHRYVLEKHALDDRVAEFEACLGAQAGTAAKPGKLPWRTLLHRFAKQQTKTWVEHKA